MSPDRKFNDDTSGRTPQSNTVTNPPSGGATADTTVTFAATATAPTGTTDDTSTRNATPDPSSAPTGDDPRVSTTRVGLTGTTARPAADDISGDDTATPTTMSTATTASLIAEA